MSGIVEIAERAGVSPATVSRALRGLHHVNEKTRAKIVKAAQELDYPLRPEVAPPGEDGRTNTIGVIAPFLFRWYFAQALAGVEEALREAGMDLLLYNFSQVDARQRIFLQRKMIGKVDGLIVISLPPTEDEFRKILNLGIPLSLLGVTDSRCPSVSIDDVQGAQIATQHLVDMGHRDIALMIGQNDQKYDFKVSSQRKEGFLGVLNENGIEFDPRNELLADYDSATAELVMDDFLRRKKLPTAIFCGSDEMAFGVYKAVIKKGMQIPEDFSIVGYDGHELSAALNLTTVAQPVRFLGQLAASQVLSQITKPGTEQRAMIVPTSLVQRGSVAKLN
ncbi:MAG: LacI family DNA-binding transcriptional regulator [Candidatus Planktophila sp.]